MTREEAIHIVDVVFDVPQAVRRAGEDRTYHEDEIREAKQMAIKALEQEPKTGHRACKDLFGNGYCSECNKFLNYSDNYYPHCGAKMESEVEDGNVD